MNEDVYNHIAKQLLMSRDMLSGEAWRNGDHPKAPYVLRKLWRAQKEIEQALNLLEGDTK